MKLGISSADVRLYSNSKFYKKVHPVGAELFHAGGRAVRGTDMTQLKVALRNFVKAPNNRRTSKQYHNPRVEGTSEDERV
jgi:hypothetical protein